MRPTILLSLLGSAALAAGCTSFESSSQREDVAVEGECECEISGDLIGVVGAFVHVGDDRYVVEEWYGTAGNYTGFRLSANAAGADYVVEAGGHPHEASGMIFEHDAKITSIDFCEDGGGGGGDDPGGGDEPPPGGDPEQGGDLPEVD